MRREHRSACFQALTCLDERAFLVSDGLVFCLQGAGLKGTGGGTTQMRNGQRLGWKHTRACLSASFYFPVSLFSSVHRGGGYAVNRMLVNGAEAVGGGLRWQSLARTEHSGTRRGGQLEGGRDAPLGGAGENVQSLVHGKASAMGWKAGARGGGGCFDCSTSAPLQTLELHLHKENRPSNKRLPPPPPRKVHILHPPKRPAQHCVACAGEVHAREAVPRTLSLGNGEAPGGSHRAVSAGGRLAQHEEQTPQRIRARQEGAAADSEGEGLGKGSAGDVLLLTPLAAWLGIPSGQIGGGSCEDQREPPPHELTLRPALPRLLPQDTRGAGEMGQKGEGRS